jgi:hypothetical protein
MLHLRARGFAPLTQNGSTKLNLQLESANRWGSIGMPDHTGDPDSDKWIKFAVRFNGIHTNRPKR